MRIQAHFLCYLGRLLPSQSLEAALLVSPKLCLHWWGRRSLGKGIPGLVKRTRAAGAKVGTFEAKWGSPAVSELGLESLLQPLSEGAWKEGSSLLSN